MKTGFIEQRMKRIGSGESLRTFLVASAMNTTDVLGTSIIEQGSSQRDYFGHNPHETFRQRSNTLRFRPYMGIKAPIDTTAALLNNYTPEHLAHSQMQEIHEIATHLQSSPRIYRTLPMAHDRLCLIDSESAKLLQEHGIEFRTTVTESEFYHLLAHEGIAYQGVYQDKSTYITVWKMTDEDRRVSNTKK